ncbi:MAG: cupin [Rhodobacteraceae bacterium]|nr:cupin [Paracoccaceae bacterium]MBR27829.1 cupin [Paracoccaceae bacterium]
MTQPQTRPRILPAAASAPFETRERCAIRELLNDPAEPETSLAEARVPPGVTTELHALDVAERYIVTDGAGEIELAGAWSPLAAGDAALIPAGTPQRARNPGPGDLVFLCLCTPRFRPEGYTPLDPA